MEIFMRNIAYAATVDDIKLVLAPKLHNPPFSTDVPLNFDVRLFHKRKGCGILCLPTQEAGVSFLTIYGPTGLMVIGRQIRFCASTQPIDDARIRYLRSRSWEDPMHIQEENKRRAEMSQPIKVKEFAFGRFCRDGAFLADKPGTGSIACDLERVQIRLNVDSEEARNDFLDVLGDILDIFENTIFASFSPSQIKSLITIDRVHNIHRVFLVSHTPAIFERQDGLASMLLSGRPPPAQRQSFLHSRPMPPMFHSLSLTFMSLNDKETFLERCKALRLPSLVTRDRVVWRKNQLLEDQLAQLDAFLGGMEFGLAFEVEKSVADAVLEHLEVISLQADLRQLSSDLGTLASGAFRFFIQKIQGRRFVQSRQRNRKGKQRRKAESERLDSDSPSLSQQLSDAVLEYKAEQLTGQPPFQSSPSFESYHLILTPTSRCLEGPLQDQSNSVLRRFEHYECFLRVSIQDEQRSKLRRESNVDITKLLKTRFLRFLVDGFRLAGRPYQFLGYSMSGLKEHAVWFVTPWESSPGEKMDAERIRSQLGNFTSLMYEPARLAARWSQAFSATDPSVTLKPTEIKHIEDRTSAQGSVFTDGCGTISPELAQVVWASLRSHRRRYSRLKNIPSCFQFRLGGAKGVVVQDPTLSGRVICLRDSQRKFEAPDLLTLDIQSTSSRPKQMFLNRPLIVLLEHHGVEQASIIALQTSSIREIQTIRKSFSQATKLFMQNGLGESFHLPSLFNNILKFLKLEVTEKPTLGGLCNRLVNDALYCAASHALREIKYRAHIMVPGSVTLIGVSDEWNCLEEGEIYATVYNEHTKEIEPITGRVLITRSPQVHPGDIQFVTAVQRPELKHLTNVVVFSCKGQRSLPSCLGGGDLDGDDYNLILDPNLHPPRTSTPGAYEPLPRKRTENPCTIKDVANFVIDYIQSDLVGYISILHLRIADLKGLDCEECELLAEKASHAVDFPKTGTPVDFKSLPRPSGQEKPDFLASEAADTTDDTRFYPSDKVLGILFRSVPTEKPTDPLEPGVNPSDTNTINTALSKIDFDLLGLPPLGDPPEELLEEMEGLLHSYYTDKLTSIAQTHAFSRHRGAMLSEEELVSGTIMAKWADHRKRREAVAALNLQTHELVRIIREDLRRVDVTSYADETQNDAEDEEDEEEMDDFKRGEILKRAWAAWKVADEALYDELPVFGAQSFGLIALGVLLEIVKDASNEFENFVHVL